MADPGELMKRWFRAIDQNDVEVALSLCSEGVEWVTPTATMKGREELRPFFAGFTEGFPDSRFDVKRVITSGTTVIAEGNYVGTHTGGLSEPCGGDPSDTTAGGHSFRQRFRGGGGRDHRSARLLGRDGVHEPARRPRAAPEVAPGDTLRRPSLSSRCS